MVIYNNETSDEFYENINWATFPFIAVFTSVLNIRLGHSLYTYQVFCPRQCIRLVT